MRRTNSELFNDYLSNKDKFNRAFKAGKSKKCQEYFYALTGLHIKKWTTIKPYYNAYLRHTANNVGAHILQPFGWVIENLESFREV